MFIIKFMRKRGVLIAVALFFLLFLLNMSIANVGIVNAAAPSGKLGDYNNDGCVREDDYSGFNEYYNNLEIPVENNLANLNGDDGVTMDDFFYFSELVNNDLNCIVGGENKLVDVDEDSGIDENIVDKKTFEDFDEQVQDEMPEGIDDVDNKAVEDENNQIDEYEESKGRVKVASAPVLNGVAKDDEVILSWLRSEIIEEELTGKIVLQRITGGLLINKITGRVGFIDSVIDWFRRLFGGEARGERIKDVDVGEISYKIERMGDLGNFQFIGEILDDDCEEKCVYRDNVDESGTYNYKVEACLDDICRSSNVVDVEVVLLVDTIDAEDVGEGDVVNVDDDNAGEDGFGGGDVDDGKTDGICNPIEVFKECANFIGDKQKMSECKEDKIIPCCSRIQSNPDANENDKIACSNVGGIL